MKSEKGSELSIDTDYVQEVQEELERLRLEQGGVSAALLIVQNRLWCGSAQFKLCAHFLDLPLQISKGSLEFLTLLGNHRFQFLDLAVLF